MGGGENVGLGGGGENVGLVGGGGEGCDLGDGGLGERIVWGEGFGGSVDALRSRYCGSARRCWRYLSFLHNQILYRSCESARIIPQPLVF